MVKLNAVIPSILLKLMVVCISGKLHGQPLPPKQPFPFNIKQIHSGHSLTDPLFYPHWP